MENVNAVPVGTEQATRVADLPANANPPGPDSAPVTPGDKLAAATESALNALDKLAGEPRRLISRDAIRGRTARRYMEILVPEWDNATVRIQSLTADERDYYEDSFYVKTRSGDREQNLKHMRARLTRMSVVDDSGALIFNADDEGWLGEQDAAALDRIFTASARFSRISKVDVEDEVKNSKRTR